MKAPKYPDHLCMDGIIVVPEREDFSDYMWMVDVESFDKEVLAELQEEEEMEQCIEEMLAEEEARDTTYYLVEEGDSPVYPCLAFPCPFITDDEFELEESMANLGFSDERILIVSELNPDAEEFIPSRMSTPSSGNSADEHPTLTPKQRDEPDR